MDAIVWEEGREREEESVWVTRDQTLVQNLEVSHKATIVVPSITQTLFVIFFHTDMNIETF